MKRHRFCLLVVSIAIGIPLVAAGGLVVSSEGLFDGGAKPPLTFVQPKGTPVPAPPAALTGPENEWTVVPPESRTDIRMIDVTEARLFLPAPDDAADCEQGDLDPAKAEQLIRSWLDANRVRLSRSSVWERTQILVTCRYPSDEVTGKVVLYIGIPYDGHSFVAPPSCQEKSKALSGDEPLPPECLTPPDLKSPMEIASYTILASPEEVLK